MTWGRHHHVRGRRTRNRGTNQVVGRRCQREEWNLDSPDTPSLESFLDLLEDETEVELQPLTVGDGHTNELITERYPEHQTSNNSWVGPIFEPDSEGSQIVEQHVGRLRHQFFLGNMAEEGGEEVNYNVTFAFPIRDYDEDAPMKTIPHSTLPIFYGLPSEDPDTFLFLFDVLCCS